MRLPSFQSLLYWYLEYFDEGNIKSIMLREWLDVLLMIQCTCVLLTSDKVYENVEWIWGYRETDAVGGKGCIFVF